MSNIYSPSRPKKKAQEPDALTAALDGTYSIASVGIATLHMLETLLPAAAKEVEHESRNLTEHFTCVMSYLNAQDDALPDPVRKAVKGIVVGLQFQDRNTQIMENVTCILERYRDMLEEVCSNISNMRDGSVATGHNIARAVEHILSSIRLSDIRTRYMEALTKAQVSHVDQSLPALSPEENRDVELF